MFSAWQYTSCKILEEGFAFLRKSHGDCDSPPDCCIELLESAVNIRSPTPNGVGLFVAVLNLKYYYVREQQMNKRKRRSRIILIKFPETMLTNDVCRDTI